MSHPIQATVSHVGETGLSLAGAVAALTGWPPGGRQILLVAKYQKYPAKLKNEIISQRKKAGGGRSLLLQKGAVGRDGANACSSFFGQGRKDSCGASDCLAVGTTSGPRYAEGASWPPAFVFPLGTACRPRRASRKAALTRRARAQWVVQKKDERCKDIVKHFADDLHTPAACTEWVRKLVEINKKDDKLRTIQDTSKLKIVGTSSLHPRSRCFCTVTLPPSL